MYSIDESFVGLEGNLEQVRSVAAQIRAAIDQSIGVPVCVGVSSTKTLAKLANHIAKHNPGLGGVCVQQLMDPEVLENILHRVPVTDVWGVGRKTGAKLAAMGIESIADLQAADPLAIRKKFSVVLQRTVFELNGQRCIGPVEERADRGQVMFTRSFSTPVRTHEAMEEVMSIYAQKAASRLAREGRYAALLTVTAGTSRFARGEASFPSAQVRLPRSTRDPILLSKLAIAAMRDLMQPGIDYVRGGVILSGLSDSPGEQQLDLFGQSTDPAAEEQENVSSVVQDISVRFGAKSIGLGHAGMAKSPEWSMKREHISQRCTTDWDELLVVQA